MKCSFLFNLCAWSKWFIVFGPPSIVDFVDWLDSYWGGIVFYCLYILLVASLGIHSIFSVYFEVDCWCFFFIIFSCFTHKKKFKEEGGLRRTYFSFVKLKGNQLTTFSSLCQVKDFKAVVVLIWCSLGASFHSLRSSTKLSWLFLGGKWKKIWKATPLCIFWTL